MLDGRPSGSEPVQVRELRPEEIPRRRGLGADDAPDDPRESAYLVLLAQDRPDRALGLLQRLRASAIAPGRTSSVIEIQALPALAAGAGGEQATAVSVPAQALTLAWTQVARLLLAFDDNPAAPRPDPGPVAAAPGPIDALTAREQEVLGLLAAGRSNRRIATELVVTLDTVKKHVGHILAKLGAANRTEAVARARQLGLIG
jgi:LuxR family maltose regulon positive regulatory protein